jgi:hypothetical protein
MAVLSGLMLNRSEITNLFLGYSSVNLLDFSILKKTYGKSKGMSGYDKRADFDEDEAISLSDFSIFKKNYGKCASD